MKRLVVTIMPETVKFEIKSLGFVDLLSEHNKSPDFVIDDEVISLAKKHGVEDFEYKYED